FARAKTLFGTFEVGDVGYCREQSDDFAISPLWLIAATQRLRLAGPIRQIDFELELDRLAGEALAKVRLKDCPGFFAHHLRDASADDLFRHEAMPFRIVPVDELVAGFHVAVRNGDRDVIVRDQAPLTLAVAPRSLCRLLRGGLSKLCHRHRPRGRLRSAAP